MIHKDFNKHVENIDSNLIRFSSKFSVRAARIAIGIIFFWFGALKLLGLSEVDELIIQLSNTLAPTLSGVSMVVGIGVLEILIAFTIFDKDLARLSILFLAVHLILVSLPLFFLPEITWNGIFVPTFEGQYILKNILIIVVAMSIVANLRHFKDRVAQEQKP